jgi:hypothetical protein
MKSSFFAAFSLVASTFALFIEGGFSLSAAQWWCPICTLISPPDQSIDELLRKGTYYPKQEETETRTLPPLLLEETEATTRAPKQIEPSLTRARTHTSSLEQAPMRARKVASGSPVRARREASRHGR